jgi:hypothetical protein
MRTFEKVTSELSLLTAKDNALKDKRKDIAEEIRELRKELIALMNGENIRQFRNDYGLFYFTQKEKAIIKDYEVLAEYIYDNRRLDLINLSPSKQALEEEIPGIERLEYRILNVRGKKNAR